MKAFRLILFVSMLAISTIAADAQDNGQSELKPFNGIVTDLLGTPLKRVKAYLHTPKVFATSDKRGHFGFSNVADDDTLHIVYHKQTYIIPLEGRRGMRVRLGDQLESNVENDEQLVDLGYGFVKRREHTGSSNGITRDELISTGQTELMSALRARVPGLTVSNSGAIGEKNNVYIRGISSINCDITPLYLIDGVKTESLDRMTVYEVEYVEIIKDANIYGVQGANGVISVHTVRAH